MKPDELGFAVGHRAPKAPLRRALCQLAGQVRRAAPGRDGSITGDRGEPLSVADMILPSAADACLRSALRVYQQQCDRARCGLRASIRQVPFFVVRIFPTRFPTELLTTGWGMAGLDGW